MKNSDRTGFRDKLEIAWQQHQAGRLAAARAGYAELLTRNPAHPDVNNLMGLLCIQAGRPDEAERFIGAALRSDPGNAQAHYNLGIACASQQRFAEATGHFSAAARLRPDDVETLSSLGNAQRLAGQTGAAVETLRAALRVTAHHPGARQNLGLALNDAGAALNRSGDSSAAIEHFREALRYVPKHPQTLINLGLTLEQTGKLTEAADHYKAAIRARPDFVDAHFHLAHLRTHRSTPGEVEAMRMLAGRDGSSPDERIKLAFGLGFALESIGDYPAAFAQMSEGHKLQALEKSYDPEQDRQQFDTLRRLFSAGRLEAAQRHPDADGERIVFVAGMPRSGTTLAEQVLASHPEVSGRGESTALSAAAARLGWPFSDGLSGLSPTRIEREREVLLQGLVRDAAASSRIVDTTPMNFLHFGLAALLLPGARFVHCLRDPMDNGLSIFRQYLTGPRGFEHDLRDLGRFYRLHLDLLRHWEEVLGDRLYVLPYERLVREPEDETRRLLNFLALDFDPRCLAFHETDRAVRSPSAAQVRQPLYASSIGAWRNYAEFLKPLADALADIGTPGGNSLP